MAYGENRSHGTFRRLDADGDRRGLLLLIRRLRAEDRK